MLKLHSVPGRIADDRIEAAVQLGLLPIRPDAWERDLPVQKALTINQRLRIVEQRSETLRVLRARQIGCGALGDVYGIAQAPVQPGKVRFPVLAVPQVEPFECMEKGQERVQWSRHFRDFRKDVGGAVRFSDLGVGQILNDLHGGRRAGRSIERSFQEQAALTFRAVKSGPHPGAEKAVAAAQMMVQETERCPDRESVQPQ